MSTTIKSLFFSDKNKQTNMEYPKPIPMASLKPLPPSKRPTIKKHGTVNPCFEKQDGHWRCKECNNNAFFADSVAGRKGAQQHVKSVHTSRFKCGTCEKAFTSKQVKTQSVQKVILLKLNVAHGLVCIHLDVRKQVHVQHLILAE